MPAQLTETATWPLDNRNLLPVAHQRAAWRALAEARSLLSDIALTTRLLSASAFAGQGASRALSATLHQALLELEVELGAQGVLEYTTPVDQP